jgi:hypothetical protein
VQTKLGYHLHLTITTCVCHVVSAERTMLDTYAIINTVYSVDDITPVSGYRYHTTKPINFICVICYHILTFVASLYKMPALRPRVLA